MAKFPINAPKHVSKAEFIRESLDKSLNEVPVEDDPAMELVGLGRSGKRDLSIQHDRYLTRYHTSKEK